MTTRLTRKDLLKRANQWKKVLILLQDDDIGIDEITDKHPWLVDDPLNDTATCATSPSQGDPLHSGVMTLLAEETGIHSKAAWQNIFWLISKSEHNNEDREKAFESDRKGISVFAFAQRLSYDWKERGVTLGLVGFTTAYDGKDAKGDAIDLFKIYKTLGGKDLIPLALGCTKSQKQCDSLINAIQAVASDPKWIEAQWKALLAPNGYLRRTVDTWKKIGISQPSALAIAAVLDTSLNQGWDGKDGGCIMLEKLAIKGEESKTLERYLEWKSKVAGTNDYNSPPVNGRNRAKQFQDLLQEKQYTLDGEEAIKAIKKAISWTMK